MRMRFKRNIRKGFPFSDDIQRLSRLSDRCVVFSFLMLIPKHLYHKLSVFEIETLCHPAQPYSNERDVQQNLLPVCESCLEVGSLT